MIKKFKDILEGVSQYPQYSKGEIIIFTDKNYSDFVIKLWAEDLGSEYVGDYEWEDSNYEREGGFAHVIKTPEGKEDEKGKLFVKLSQVYSYRRRDLRRDYKKDIKNQLGMDMDKIINQIDHKFIDKENFNNDVDSIIKKLNDLKI